ncbi:hypothetical protein [Citrobacter portucalensis]|uniref:hypothetical protein n=1 Tax=Citrobacter portucalensis TaxID=1639133 RepID=UPI001F14EA33|nr:hypothetical protein [Citrobacter portucalensis]
MTALNKQALIAKIKKQTESFDTVVLKEDEANALLDELEAAERQNGYLREQRDEWERKAISNFEECAEMSARIEELEAQRKLAFTASNRWADKFRESEKRIAELEARPANPINFKENADADYCRGWAWNEVKKELSPEDWTVGDNCTYYGFFCWGWDSRRQFNEQRAAGIGVKGE